MDPIFLLTTLDQNYLPQLQVLLTSISVNNPKDTFVLILLHSDIPEGGPGRGAAAVRGIEICVSADPDG